MSAAESHAHPGALIADRYRVEHLLGAGGMGIVVAATHVTLGHRVAIKMVHPSSSREARVAAERFIREARIAASLDSAHVARVYDFGVLPDGTPFMVLEYLEGEDLARLLEQRGPLPLDEAVDLVAQACAAVGLAHAQGVVHRDLTPSNLFLARRAGGRPIVKVLDFGIARLGAGVPGRTLTSSNALLGSPVYAAPEQLRSAHDATPRSDVWSLGAVLYELLAGSPAFTGETVAETCTAVLNASPRPLGEVRPNAPPRLREIVHRCLASDPADRQADASELGRQLERYLREAAIGTMDTLPALSSSHPRITTFDHAPHSDAPVALLSARPAPLVDRRRRSLGWTLATVQGLALVVGGVLVLRAGTGHPRDVAMGSQAPMVLEAGGLAAAIPEPEGDASANSDAGQDAPLAPSLARPRPLAAHAAPSSTREGVTRGGVTKDAGVVVDSQPAQPSEPPSRKESWPWGARK